MNEEQTRPGEMPGTAGQMRDKVRETAADLASGAKEQAEAQYEKHKDTAVGELDMMAQTLRRVGNEMRDQGRSGMAASLTSTAADRLESMSRSFSGKDLGEIVHDVERFARRNPAAFLGTAVAAGFFISRFLKSSSPSQHFSGHDDGGRYAQPWSGSGYETGFGRDRGNAGMAGSDRGLDRGYDVGAGFGSSNARPYGAGVDRDEPRSGMDVSGSSPGIGMGAIGTTSGSDLASGSEKPAAGFSSGADLDRKNSDRPPAGSKPSGSTTPATPRGGSTTNRGGNKSGSGGR